MTRASPQPRVNPPWSIPSLLATGWRSATFFTWLLQLSSYLKFLVVTPFLLIRFSPAEAAIWFLVASVTQFALIPSNRVQWTFSRMVSLALGGGLSMGPRNTIEERAESQEPNWSAIVRISGFLGVAQVFISLLEFGLMLALTLYVLRGLLGEPGVGEEVVPGVVLMLFAQVFCGYFRKYRHLLLGLNQVAVLCRYDLLFEIAFVLGACAALWLHGGFLLLVVLTQATQLGKSLVYVWLYGRFDHGRLAHGPRLVWCPQILTWAWPSLWRGLVVELCSLGVIQLSMIYYGGLKSEAAAVASLLFSMRVVGILRQGSGAPLLSAQPRLTRIMQEGARERFIGEVMRRSALGMWLLATGVVLFAAAGPPLLSLIGSKFNLLPPSLLLLLGTLVLLNQINSFAINICGMGNRQVLWPTSVVSALLTLCLLSPAYERFGVAGLIAVTWGAPLVAVNYLAIVRVRDFMRYSGWRFLRVLSAPLLMVALYWAMR